MSLQPHHNDAPPYWASLLTSRDFRAFIAGVQGYFKKRSISIELDAEHGVIRPTDGTLGTSSGFGLLNLLQSCARLPTSKWSGAIAHHFDAILNAPQSENALSLDATNFEAIKSLLRARIYPDDVTDYFAELVYRFGPQGTLEVLVIDLPKSVRTVALSEIAGWPVGEEELFAIGRRNLATQHELKRHVVALPIGPTLTFYTGDPFYAASHALLIEDLLPKDQVHGALVGIPRRDVLVVHPITNIGMMDALSAMLHVIYDMHADGPGSVSACLYWFHRDTFVELPYEHPDANNDFRLTPPDDFIELMDELEDVAQLS